MTRFDLRRFQVLLQATKILKTCSEYRPVLEGLYHRDKEFSNFLNIHKKKDILPNLITSFLKAKLYSKFT